MYVYKLVCGHQVASEVNISLQYPDDKHYIFCPDCKGTGAAIAYQEVAGASHVSDVPSRAKGILPGDIIRVQPRLRGSKRATRPFPYVTGPGQYS